MPLIISTELYFIQMVAICLLDGEFAKKGIFYFACVVVGTVVVVDDGIRNGRVYLLASFHLLLFGALFSQKLLSCLENEKFFLLHAEREQPDHLFTHCCQQLPPIIFLYIAQTKKKKQHHHLQFYKSLGHLRTQN